LITLVPKWTGTDAAVTLEGFIASIESSARIGKWEEADNVEIALINWLVQPRHFIKDVPNFTRMV